MTEHNVTFPYASGLTGFISRLLGLHPLIAAGIKYASIAGLVFGSYAVWKHNVKKDIVKDIIVQEQSEIIGEQKQSAENQAQDAAAKSQHIENSAESELKRLRTLSERQSKRILKLEANYENLDEAVKTRPDLLEPWPVELQRSGGVDLNRNSNESRNPDADRGGDKN